MCHFDPPLGGVTVNLRNGFFIQTLGAGHFCKLPCGFLVQGLYLMVGYGAKDAESCRNRRGRICVYIYVRGLCFFFVSLCHKASPNVTRIPRWGASLFFDQVVFLSPP